MIQSDGSEITKADYYKELHSAARNYNTKLWTIPGLFIVVAGFLLETLDLESIDSFVSFRNFVLLIGGGAIIFMLLLQAAKDSYFQISIQKKINELEKELSGMPLYSATDIEITRRLQQLKEFPDQDGNHALFPRWRECLVRFNVSIVFFGIVWTSLTAIVVGLILMGLRIFK